MEKSTESFHLDENEKSEPDDSQEHYEENEHSTRSLPYKIVKTIVLVLVWISMGLWSEVNGPAQPDLMYRTKSNYETISQAISMRGVGSMCGAVVAGPIVDAFKHRSELIVALSLVVGAAVTSVVPFTPYVEVLYAVYVVQGIFGAFINIAGQYLVMQTWLGKANAPLHFLHLGYGAGGFLVPQIVKSFISTNIPTNSEKNETFTYKCLQLEAANATNATNATTAAPQQNTDNFHWGFIIISGIVVVISAMLFIDAILVRNRKTMLSQAQEDEQSEAKSSTEKVKEIFNLNTCSPGSPYFAFNIYVYLFFWTFLAVIGERVFAKYLYSFARNVSCFSKDKAVNLQSAFWIAFTGGRCSGFLLTNFIPMSVIILAEGGVNLAASIVLYFYYENEIVLWVCVITMGIFIGPCYPSGLAWANHYIKVTGLGLTVLSLGAGVSDITFLSTIGYFIDQLSLKVVPAFILGYGVCVFVLPVIMNATACPKGDRFKRHEDKSVPVIVESDTKL